MRAKLLLGLLALAIPASAQTPNFSIVLSCDGNVPVAMSITANRVGKLEFTISELIDRCMAQDQQDAERGKEKQI
jgi:hypothetical protein